MEIKMKKQIRLILLGMLAIVAISFRPEVSLAKVSVASEAACVLDAQSGAVLYNKNMNKREYPASITKIMTTLVALENSSLSEEVEYTNNAFANWESGASNIEIEVGERISMEQSLYGIMLMSANEACNGVAEHVAGDIDSFVVRMNDRAKELGCKNTHFANTNGLWRKDHYTTPYDMALIGRAAIRNKSFKEITNTKQYIMSKTNKRKAGYILNNHHKMINSAEYPQYAYEYCEGGKTGYTVKCKSTLVTFAKKGDMELVCVVMRCENPTYMEPNVYTDTTKLFNYCFENYDKIKIEDNVASDINEQYLFTNFSPFYSNKTSALHLEEDAGVILPKGVTIDKAEKKVEFYPQAKEDNGKKVIGKLSYSYKGKEAGASNIYYNDNESPTLKDSIDMSQWFVEAQKKANAEPFPWKKVIVIVILVCCVVGLSIICFIKIRGYQSKTNSRRRHRRGRRKMNKQERAFYTRRLK